MGNGDCIAAEPGGVSRGAKDLRQSQNRDLLKFEEKMLFTVKGPDLEIVTCSL